MNVNKYRLDSQMFLHRLEEFPARAGFLPTLAALTSSNCGDVWDHFLYSGGEDRFACSYYYLQEKRQHRSVPIKQPTGIKKTLGGQRRVPAFPGFLVCHKQRNAATPPE